MDKTVLPSALESKSDIAEKDSAIRSLIDDDHRNVEARRRLRTEHVKDIEQILTVGRRAYGEWVAGETASLEHRLTATPNGDQATETRRLRQTMEVDRLISTARLDTSTVVVNGRPMPKTDRHAIEYAEKAEKAFIGRDAAEAQTYARASVELGGDARHILLAAEAEIYPDRKSALDELDTLEITAWTFEADVSADTADAMHNAATAAKAIGDDPSPYRAKMSELSIHAKSAAMLRSKKQGTKYVEPAGLRSIERSASEQYNPPTHRHTAADPRDGDA